MTEGFYYIVNSKGSPIWVYKALAMALMELLTYQMNGLTGFAIVYNSQVVYRLSENGIEKIGA